MSPFLFLGCFAFGLVVAGGLFWILVRAIDRGWRLPWLDSMNESSTKGYAIAFAVLSSCCVVAIATLMIQSKAGR